MLDLVKLKLLAGDGGNGRVSFRREKYIPKGGPDGGNGGAGGSIILVGNKHLNTLGQLSGVKELLAKNGQAGGKKKKSGAAGEDLIIEVPVGTVVWLLAERLGGQLNKFYLEREGQTTPERNRPNWILAPGEQNLQIEELVSLSLKNLNLKDLPKQKLIEISEHGQKVVLCQGGAGGRGNDAFKSAGNRIPLEAEYGEFGEQKLVLLELKLIADVGLVGFPSVGKSSFLNRVTKARSKVGAYPFTTLEAHLGVWRLGGPTSSGLRGAKEAVLADIPGLIAGASRGKGLGIEFLRHVERTRVLVYMLASDNLVQVTSEGLSLENLKDDLQQQFVQLRAELGEYEPELLKKPYLVAINKIDLLSEDLRLKIKDLEFGKTEKLRNLETKNLHATSYTIYPILISVATGEGLNELGKKVLKEISNS